MNLSNTQLFRGLETTEITSLLNCLNTTEHSYKKGEVILSEGSITENIGIVLSGMVMIFGEIAAFWEMLPLVPYLVKYMPVFRANQCWLQCLQLKILLYYL